jgi:hypothetical protein
VSRCLVFTFALLVVVSACGNTCPGPKGAPQPTSRIELSSLCGIDTSSTTCKAPLVCTATDCVMQRVVDETCSITLKLGDGEVVTGSVSFHLYHGPCGDLIEAKYNGISDAIEIGSLQCGIDAGKLDGSHD